MAACIAPQDAPAEMFGDSLKQRRKTLDPTQAELACWGFLLPPVTIEKIEAGQRWPSKQLIDLLATALNDRPDTSCEGFRRVARWMRALSLVPRRLPAEAACAPSAHPESKQAHPSDRARPTGGVKVMLLAKASVCSP